MNTSTAIQEEALKHSEHHTPDAEQSHDVGHAHDEHHHDTSDMTLFGFWIYIMSDCLLFATVFVVYAVMSAGNSYGSAIEPQELFGLGLVFFETMLLLVSSFTFGMAMLGAQAKNMDKMKKWLMATFALGFIFLCLEMYEFYHLVHAGATPQASGYWTAFFTLVGTHGLHVFVGLCWMVAMVFHFKRDGFSEGNLVRLACLSLFWHFLDIIWICVFSFVYLAGVL